VSKNGALLLNVGPRADGTIPEEEAEILLAIGRWLAVNSEAIYGTRPWKVFGEGPTEVASGSFTDTNREPFTAGDVRYTTRGDCLYAIVLGVPREETVLRSLGTHLRLCPRTVARVDLLGSEQPVAWTRDAEGLRIAPPAESPCEHAVAYRITLG